MVSQPAADETRFRALVEALPVLVFVAGPGGSNIYANAQTAAYSGVPVEELLGSGWLRLLSPQDRPVAEEAWRHARAVGQPCEREVRIRRRDGEYRLHACRIEPSRDQHGELVEWIGACVDIEDRRRAQAELRDRVGDLQTLLDTLPIGVFIAHDPDCRRISGNRAAADLLQLPLDANLSKTASAEQVPMHFRIMKNGKEIPPDELPVQRAARGEVVQSEEVDHEFENGTVVHTLISARPLYDEASRPRGAVAAILDITQLKSVEASDRRKAQFLAELSHELRTPLAPLMTALELLRRDCFDAKSAAVMIETMRRQLGYLIELVDDLSDVARVSRGDIELHTKPLDLREVVQAAIEMAGPTIEERRHDLVVEHAEAPIRILGDARRLTQVVVNLLINAAKYTDPNGTISVRTEGCSDQAILRVSDTGLGVPADQQEEIFRMFARVPSHRAAGGGMGIGLALVRRIVEMHRGSVEVHSEGLGHGSEFVVRLPLAEDADPRDNAPSAFTPGA